MALPRNFITPEEYLKMERASQEKHEYFAGEIFAMTGASENHNMIVFNISGLLHAQLRKSACRAYASDMRLKTPPPVLYTYPDIAVVCNKPVFDDDEHLDTLLNPTLIIEVLSPSTENYDRGTKFLHYRTIESLREYVLIAQDSYRIERFLRQPDNQWLLVDLVGKDAILELPSIGCTLALADVYEKVEFETE
jgi:Uma2 family endonuclease